MDGVIVPFVGLAEKTVRENVAGFIEHARGMRFFRGPDALAWDANTWDLRARTASRGHQGSSVLHFVNFESTGSAADHARAIIMPQPFLDAAKALVTEAILSARVSAPYRRLMALRALEKAFRDLGLLADISLLSPAVLDRAATIILESHADQAGYCSALEGIARTASDKLLSSVHLTWKNPRPAERGQRRSVRVREDGASDVVEKLPHLKCILDLASVFQGATMGADMVTTAWFALAMYAPSRISEILTLPVRCETEMGGVYGLSWHPSKGGAELTKFATTPEWADVVKRAIARLTEWGAPARRAAAWYAKNPGALYLPPGTEHLRGEGLTQHEVYAILGVAEGGFNDYALSRVLTPAPKTTTDPTRTGGRRRARLYEFASLERFVLDHLPFGFPVADKKFGLLAHDALFCVPRHTMRANVAIHANVPDLIDAGQIHKDLNGLASTIFARHGLLDPATGRPWTLTSHQPRHLLNTLAQSKHVSQTLIAFWSGRKRVDQNSWYDHVPHEAFIEMYVAMGEHSPRSVKVVGPLADKVAERVRREMVTHDEALRLEVGSVISTRFGLCRHNYALTPCPKDKNCISCGENTFIKGDQRHLSEARSQLALSERAVQNCLAAIENDEPGVEPWLKKHREAASRWARVIDMMLDPDLEDGTLITLPPPEVSQTKSGLSLGIRAAEGPSVTGRGDMDTLLDLAGEA